MNKPLSSYPNDSYHLGVNLRESRIDIADWYATYLANLDISIKGARKKRKEPKIVATLNGSATGYVNGAASFTDSTGQAWGVFTLDGKLYKWDGTEGGTTGNGHVTEYSVSGVGSLSATNRIRFAQAQNKLYFVDGVNGLMRFTGSAAAAVAGTSALLPLVPGSVSIYDQHSHTVTDDGHGNLVYATNNIGTIDYTTGAYTLTSNPFTNGDTVTAAYTYGTTQTTATVGTSAVDGSLEYPSLPNAPIVAGSLELHGAGVDVTSNSTQATGFPTGWKQLIHSAAQCGGYDPETGKFAVTSAIFNAADSIFADYRTADGTGYDSSINSELYVDEYEVGHEFTPAGSLSHAPVVIVGSDPDDAGVTFTNFYANLTCKVRANGAIYDVNDTGTDLFGPGTFNFTTGEWPDLGTATGTLQNTWQGSCSYTYEYERTGIFVGTTDSAGKLYRFTVNPPSGPGHVTVTLVQAGNTAVATYDGSSSNSFIKGGATVGTLTWANGVVAVTSAGTFGGVAEVTATYWATASTTATLVNGATAGVIGSTIPVGGDDILWWNDRLWVVIGNSIMVSNAYAPETFSLAPLSVSAGGKLRLCGYSYNRLIIFKGESGAQGEVFYVDTSDSTPSNWKAISVFGGMNFVATECIQRAANNDQSDIFYPTIEGVRTLKFTLQDRVAAPSLPFSDNVRAWWTDEVEKTALNTAWAVCVDDEYLMFLPSTNASTPDFALAYNMKVPRTTPMDGWTRIDMPTGTYTGINSFCGCVCDFGSGNTLYVGTVTGGKVVQAFHSHQGHFTATEISKGITFSTPDNPSLRFCAHAPRKILVRFGPNTATNATIAVSLIGDDGTTYAIGTATYTGEPVVGMDATYPASGTAAQRLKPSKDWRVQITTTGNVEIQGFEFMADSFKPSFVQLGDSNVGVVTDTALSSTAIADTAI